ncbi:MAG: hypothetical protein IT439_04080 [Phycisphaerales bacterium]|nr:hypothetical protein [Phycisphaerales bacterium]
MKSHSRGAAALLPCLLALSGCAIHIGDHDAFDAPEYQRVTGSELAKVVAANRGLTLGMPRDEALGRFPAALTSLRSTARQDDLEVEEWLVRAVDRRTPAIFERWLYFANGRLVEVSDERISYRDGDGLRQWRAFIGS